jgi:transposase
MRTDQMSEEVTERKANRRHSAEFKAQVIAQCRVRGASVIAVAKANGIGDSLLYSWIAKHRSKSIAPSKPSAAEFIELPVSQASDMPIHVEVRKGSLQMSIDWPSSAAVAAAVWLREVLA